MKRHTAKWKRYLEWQRFIKRIRTCRNYIEQLRARERRGIRLNKKSKQKSTFQENESPTVVLTAPSVFDLRSNREEMLSFYDQLRNTIASQRKCLIRMEDVSVVTVGSMLYLVAILRDDAQSKINVSGTIPRDTKCVSIIQASGFYDFVHTDRYVKVSSESKIAKIEVHKKHDTNAITELCQFSCDCLGTSLATDAAPLYATLSELVQNTIGHAYKKTAKGGKWYVAAQYMQDDGEVEVTFLDTGEGIPNTVKRRFYEVPVIPFVGKDESLILSALKGELRTSTGLSYRGKGLPEIYNYFLNGDICKLAIASGKGFIDMSEPIHLKNEFFGTLFSFRVTGDASERTLRRN